MANSELLDQVVVQCQEEAFRYLMVHLERWVQHFLNYLGMHDFELLGKLMAGSCLDSHRDLVRLSGLSDFGSMLLRLLHQKPSALATAVVVKSGHLGDCYDVTGDSGLLD